MAASPASLPSPSSYRAAPAEALTFSVKHTDGVEVEIITHDQLEPAPANGGKQWPLDSKTILKARMSRPSTEANDNKVSPVGAPRPLAFHSPGQLRGGHRVLAWQPVSPGPSPSLAHQ